MKKMSEICEKKNSNQQNNLIYKHLYKQSENPDKLREGKIVLDEVITLNKKNESIKNSLHPWLNSD